MTQVDAQGLAEGFQRLLELVRAEPALAKELGDSAGAYFGGALPPADQVLATLQAARRHQEWFLFDRASSHLHGVPCERLLGAWRESGGASDELEAALLESRAAIWEVQELAAEGVVRLEDVGSLLSVLLLQDPQAAPLVPGDILAGRLFPIGENLWIASPAAAVLRGGAVHEAVLRDLGRWREQAGVALGRVDQAVLEQVIFAPLAKANEKADGSPAADPLQVARQVLVDAGLSEPAILDLFARLRRAPLDPKRWAIGTDDTLGEILDSLAFDTSVDLTRARASLLGAWHALRQEAGKPKERTRSVQEALAAFDEGRARGRDVMGLLDELELDLGLDDVEDQEDGRGTGAVGGAAAALVAEFRWQSGRPDREGDGLSLLTEFGAAFEQPEELDGPALKRLVAFFCMERRASAQEFGLLLASLDPFADWALREQELDLTGALAEIQAARPDLERLLEINFAAGPASDGEGELFEVLAGEEPKGLPGLLVVQDSGAPQRVQPEPAPYRALRAGDLVRATLLGDRLCVRTAYAPLGRGPGA